MLLVALSKWCLLTLIPYFSKLSILNAVVRYNDKRNHDEVMIMSDNILSDEEKALFRRLMQEVTPLGQSKKLTLRTSPPSGKLSQKIAPQNTPATQYHLSNNYHNTVSADSILSFCKQSIPQRRLRQLKSGQIPWQARLDLHGLRPDAARESLCQFIEQQSHLAHRCLLIIHGKGSRHGEAPILKNHVNHWLQQLPQILAFHSALARDGGSGALYVLLQRQR